MLPSTFFARWLAPALSPRGCMLALAVALIAPLTVSPPARAQDADPVIAKVNGMEIRNSDLALVEEELGTNIPAMTPEAKREYLITYMADVLLVAHAAELKKIPDTAEFKRRIAFARNKLLMETLLQEAVTSALTDEAIKRVYDEAAKAMANETEVRARHILVATEEEAKAIIEELKKGADFAELAKARSKDPGAADGGDLGYFTKDQMVPEFAEVAFKLDKGQISDPVKTQFGYHIIKVEDKRPRQIPPLDKVRPQIVNYVTRRTQAEIITKLRQGADIERLDKTPTVTPPAPPPSPAPPAK